MPTQHVRGASARGRGYLVAAAVGLLALLAPGPAQAAPSASLPTVASGPLPGPPVLYAPVAAAPQLQNNGIWTAPPILVSGATAYRQGEFLYQDYLYDDHGARQQPDPNDPRTGGDSFSRPNGTYTYPTDPVYAGNAADLVELRIRPLADATALRITLNTLKDPSLTATTIALGSSAVARPVPHGANATAKAKVFVTVHGSTGDIVDAATGTTLAQVPSVTVDMTRRQIDVRVPHAAFDPGSRTVRVSAATGLWDPAAGVYLVPAATRSAARPGGAGLAAAPTAFFNAAFRTNEPLPKIGDPVGTAASPAWWRDRAQGTALAAGNLSRFGMGVDFAKLRAGTTDDAGVPTAGAMDRILASHFETAQGTDYSTSCGTNSGCKGELRGQLQPYAIYVPAAPPPGSGYGLTLQMHSLAANYNQYLGSRNQSQFGDRPRPRIVMTPSGRGPDGWYVEYAGADTFEVWADIATHYRLDPSYTDVTGYSMGGYGTFRFATRYPDLFAKAFTTVGPPGIGVWLGPGAQPTGGPGSLTYDQLGSMRNVPVDMWVQKSDELVPFTGTQAQAGVPGTAGGFDGLGYRYRFRAYESGEHLTLSLNDEYAPAADFLADTTVNLNPPHVTYVENPSMDFPDVGMVGGHAYWLSGVGVRDPGAQLRGRIDARSAGFGVGDAPALPTQPLAGALTGGNLGPATFTGQQKQWGPTPAEPVADVVHISATNIRSATIDVARARVSCNVTLDVTSDGPITIELPGCNRSDTFGGTTAPGATVPEAPSAALVGVAAAGLLGAVVHRRRRLRLG